LWRHAPQHDLGVGVGEFGRGEELRLAERATHHVWRRQHHMRAGNVLQFKERERGIEK